MAPGVATVEQTKSKRPSSSAFKQQRLPAWQPILTAGTVLPTFFIIGIAFIPVGIGLLYFSDDVKEYSQDYTDCTPYKPSFKDGIEQKCSDIINQTSCIPCKCRIHFTLNETFTGDVYIYYGLTNFYQNHRRYVKSRDDNQLLGHLGQPTSDCDPYSYVTKDGVPDKSHPIAPCGAIANSLFNDTFELHSLTMNKPVPLLNTGIAWPSDKQVKFRNPAGNLTEAFAPYSRPVNWCKNVTDLDPNNVTNNGFENEELIVWMRTAALPSFRKLNRILDRSEDGFRNGLDAGDYVLEINYAYPVSAFDGKKLFIISTTSLLGGKNPFLGIAYVVVGSVCLLLGIIFLIVHIKWGKSTSEMVNVTPRTPY